MYITSPLSPPKTGKRAYPIALSPLLAASGCPPPLASFQSGLNQAMRPHFSGKSVNRLSATDARRLMAYLRQLDVLPAKMSGDTVQARLMSGQRVTDSLYYGIVRLEHGKPVVYGMREELQPVANLLFSDSNAVSPEIRQKLMHGGMTLALRPTPSLADLRKRVNAPSTSEKSGSDSDKKPESSEKSEKSLYDQFMEQAFLPRFRMKLTDRQGNAFEQTVAWPVFQSIINNPATVSAPVRAFLEDVDRLGLYQLSSPDLDSRAVTALQARFRPLAQRLAAFKLAEKHYLDSLDFKEIVLPMLIGVIVGGGETALEMAHLDQSPSAGWIRTGLLVGVDVVDNLFAQIPNVMQGIAKNGGKLSWQSVTGSASGREYLKRCLRERDFALRGDMGDTVADAGKSASLGALTGSVFALPAGRTISDMAEPLWARAAMGGMGAWGTSLSLPFKLRRDNAKMEAALSRMLADGILSNEAIRDPGVRRGYIRKTLLREAMAGMGNAASMQAFGLVPLFSGGMQALEALGVPHKWAQKLYMSVSPGAENVLSLFFMALRQYGTAPRDMKAVESRILATGHAFGPQGNDDDFIAGRFGNSLSKSLGALVSNTAAFSICMASVLATMYFYTFRKWILKAAGVDRQKAGQGAARNAMPTNQMRLSPATSLAGAPLATHDARYMPRYLNLMPQPPLANAVAKPSTALPVASSLPSNAFIKANPLPSMQTGLIPNGQPGVAYPAWQPVVLPLPPTPLVMPLTV